MCSANFRLAFQANLLLFSLYSLIMQSKGDLFVSMHNDLTNLPRKVQFVEQSRTLSASNNGHNAHGSRGCISIT